MKFLGIFLTVVCWVGISLADTNVCGNVSGTWTLAGSPYIVTCDLTVPTGQTLSILPGVRVLFSGHYRFIVNGSLQAIGTETDSIIFTRQLPTDASKWWGIRINNNNILTRLEYCRIEYSNATGSELDSYGGGILCNTTSPIISNCFLRYNTASTAGGAICCINGSHPQISNCVILSCSSLYTGGGIFCQADADPTIDRCVIDSCIAINGNGGGLSVWDATCSPIISNSKLRYNHSQSGGGIVVRSGGRPQIDKCEFLQNSCSQDGGAICLVDGASSPYIISNSIFIMNTANWGGGIYCGTANSPQLQRCTFYGNSATENGGGIFNSSNSITINTSIISNSMQGSGICFGQIIPNIHHCNFYNNANGNFSWEVPAGLGVLNAVNLNGDSCDNFFNININPQFLDTPNGNFNLVDSSHCIDAGDPLLSYDPDSTVADIGALPYSRIFVRVTSPNGGESWRIFQNDTVRWTSGFLSSYIKVELNRYYPENNWEILTDSTENDGIEVFFITDPLSNNCRVRVSSIIGNYSDVSDGIFTITSTQGYLALARTSAPSVTVTNWNAGISECPIILSELLYFKNFGTENIIVFMPQALSGTFTRITNAPATFTLPPGQMSSYSITLNFDAPSDGTFRDTLRIQSDAANGMGGYVNIPLVGTQISTPQTPQVVITPQGNDIRLNWHPVTNSIGGCPIAATGYLVYYSPFSNGPYYYHGFTTDTTYIHTRAVQFAGSTYYQLTTFTGPLLLIEDIPPDATQTEVEEILNDHLCSPR